MPRSSVLLSATPLDADAAAAAAGTVWDSLGDPGAASFELRVLDEGAVLQVVAEGAVVLSVLRPRLLPSLDEVRRLLPGVDAPEGTSWWAEAYTPWSPEGTIGITILDAAASASRARLVHQGLARTRELG